MCMVISLKNVPRATKKPKKKIIGYKVVYMNNTNSVLRTIYKHYFLKEGVNQSSRNNIKCNSDEKYTGVIEQGFHFYANLKDALSDYMLCMVPIGFVIKCEIQPEDFVARGRTNPAFCQERALNVKPHMAVQDYIKTHYVGPLSFVATKFTLIEEVKG